MKLEIVVNNYWLDGDLVGSRNETLEFTETELRWCTDMLICAIVGTQPFHLAGYGPYGLELDATYKPQTSRWFVDVVSGRGRPNFAKLRPALLAALLVLGRGMFEPGQIGGVWVEVEKSSISCGFDAQIGYEIAHSDGFADLYDYIAEQLQ